MDRYSPHHPPFSREQTSIYHNISRYNDKSKAKRHNNSNKTYSHYIANELSKSTFHMLNPSSSLIQINSIYELSKVSIQSSFHHIYLFIHQHGIIILHGLRGGHAHLLLSHLHLVFLLFLPKEIPSTHKG